MKQATPTLAPARGQHEIPIRRKKSVAARTRSGISSTGYHLFSSILAAIFLLPILSAVLNSIKSPAEANQQPPTWFPQSFSLANYAKLASYGDGIGVYLWNSIVLS